MSETKDGPKAATLDEIKAECPDAGDSFIVAQMTANATINQARIAYAADLKAQVEKAAADHKVELDAIKAELTDKTKALEGATKKASGVPPLGTGEAGNTRDILTIQQAWDEKIQAHVALGRTRQAAASLLNRSHPQLREELVAAAN